MAEDFFDYKHNLTKSLIALFARNSLMEVRVFDENGPLMTPSYKEVLYLYSIATIENCTATDLVKLFKVSKAMVSQMLSGMEEKGYIVRKKDSIDGRKNIITISPERLKDAGEEVKVYDEAIDELHKKFTSEQIEIAAEVLAEFSTELERIGYEYENKNQKKK